MQKYINFQIPINVVHLLKRFDQFSNFVLMGPMMGLGTSRSGEVEEVGRFPSLARLSDEDLSMVLP